jgi:hypothetical protein
MSSIHEQAMNYVYQQVLQRLLGYFRRAERTALQLLIQRLIVAAGGIERIASFNVMVPFSGGKDSAYTVALLRAAQLSIAGRSPATFNLRIATMRHTGMTPAVMDNIQRTYSALFLHDDPRVELVVVDHQTVRVFEPGLPLSQACREQNRSDMLFNGHLSAGDGRTTFCNNCYLGIADFFERATTWGGGVDAVVSGDSRKEQKQYLTWAMRVAPPTAYRFADWGNQNFNGMLNIVSTISQAYNEALYGEDNDGESQPIMPVSFTNKSMAPAFIAISDLIASDTEEHWKLLTEFLGFRFDDLAFGFSESDCANPLLMAHMRGLKVQHVQGRSYAEGVAEYLQLAKAMMRSKRMPERLIDQAMNAYADDEAIASRRTLAAEFAQEGFGLSEAQLICLLFSPFVNEGRELESFLRRHHPGMLVALPELHKALQGQAAPEQVLQWLGDISGLTLPGLQSLYRKGLVDFSSQASIIARVRAADPDKKRVMSVDPHTGEAVEVMLSGR